MKSSIVPNIIHSLDASHLLDTVTRCFDSNFDVMTIHDCFGVHPNNIETLRFHLKSVFINMYISNDWLSSFHARNLEALSGFGVVEDSYIITDRGRFKIPSLPKHVTVSLYKDDIMNSEYMFS